MGSRRFEEMGRGWADTAHTTELQSGFCSVVRNGRSGQGWADTAHATELQSGFCSVVRIGRSGRGCADTAHSTELRLADMKGGGGFYPQMTQMFTDEGEDREGAGNRVLAWSPSVDILQPICG